MHNIATKWMNSHPDTVATRCAKDFPCVPEEIIFSDTVHTIDTSYLPGDSIPCPANDSGKTVYVKCLPRLVIHDSVKIHDSIPILDNARIYALAAQRDSVSRALVKISADRDRLKSGRNTWRSIAIPLIAALLAWVAAKFKWI
jgi:hypothetical protein